MAVADVSPAHHNGIGSALKGPQNMVRRYGGGAHYTNGPNVGRILQTTHARQIGSTIGAPITQKSDYLRLKTILFHLYLLFNGLKAQRTLDLGVKLIVVKSHQGRCLGGTGCRAGAAALTKSRIHFSQTFQHRSQWH